MDPLVDALHRVAEELKALREQQAAQFANPRFVAMGMIEVEKGTPEALRARLMTGIGGAPPVQG